MNELTEPEKVFARRVSEHASAAGPEEERRRALARFAGEVYSRFGRNLSHPILAALANPRVPLVQVAHDGQLPHLGIVRLVLKTAEIAHLADGVALYLIGDHYTAAMRPRNILIGMPLRGRDPDSVKQPIRLPIVPKDREVPFMFLHPPTRASLDEIEGRVLDWFEKNLAHERARGNRVDRGDEVRERIRHWFRVLASESGGASSLGEWLSRVQIAFLSEVADVENLPMLVLPMSAFRTLVADDLRKVVKRSGVDAEGEAGVWLFCRSCRSRARPAIVGGDAVLRCPSCGTENRELLDPAGENIFPDIIAYETAALRLFAGWVVGSAAAYLPEIDRAYESFWESPACPREVLASVPTFRGIGEPPAGYGRSRLLRVLFEVRGPSLRDPLSAPWKQNPRIESPHVLGR